MQPDNIMINNYQKNASGDLFPRHLILQRSNPNPFLEFNLGVNQLDT